MVTHAGREYSEDDEKVGIFNHAAKVLIRCFKYSHSNGHYLVTKLDIRPRMQQEFLPDPEHPLGSRYIPPTHHIEVYVSPTGRKVRIYVDGEEWMSFKKWMMKK